VRSVVGRSLVADRRSVGPQYYILNDYYIKYYILNDCKLHIHSYTLIKLTELDVELEYTLSYIQNVYQNAGGEHTSIHF